MGTVAEEFEQIVGELAAACAEVYGERLVSLAVFGSVARGTMRPDSDIDILVVVDPVPNGRLRRIAEFAAVESSLEARLAAAAALGIHTRLAPIFKTPAELEHGSPLLLDMTDCVRILFDSRGTLSRRLDRLRRRLVELGSRKVQREGGYYWLLKPDYKPGDIIEL